MIRAPRLRMAGPAALLMAAVLAGCVSIPTGGGVTTEDINTAAQDDDLLTLPPGPRQDATPEEIISGFISAGRGSQKNYEVAREYLTDDFRLNWIPGARTLISVTPIVPIALADNTWSVSVSTTASVDDDGRYGVAADAVALTFGVVQNADGQWRISSAPDGTLMPPNAFTRIFKPYDLYFFDPTFRFLVPDRRWLPSGSNIPRRLVSQLLLGPSDWQGAGVLFSAFPAGTEQGDAPVISSGVATVDLSSEVQAADATTKRRMLQQLTESLGSIPSVREVSIMSAGFTVAIPDTGVTPDSRYLVGSEPVGGLDGRVGIITRTGVTPIDSIGRAADPLAPVAASLARDRRSIAVLAPDGVSMIAGTAKPLLLDSRRGLLPPSLDPSGFTWTVQAGAPSGLLAIGPDGTSYPVPGLPSDSRVVSFEVSRDGARVLAALETANGPRLIVAGVARDPNDVPVSLSGTVIDLPVGDAPLIDAAWVDGITVVALSDSGDETSVDAYAIGGQSSSLGALTDGTAIVGGNGIEGTRVLDAAGQVLRPGGVRSWQATGLKASFLATQQ